MAHETLLFACFAAILAYNIFLCDFFGPLRRVPGPFLARVSRLWLYLNTTKSTPEPYVYKTQKLHDRYGPVVRLAPGRYSIADPEAVKIIYSHNSKFAKSAFYNYAGAAYKGKDLFGSRDIRQHADTRRQVGTLYSMSSMKTYEPLVDEISASLYRCFDGLAQKGSVINLPQFLQFYAFDVIGQITFGHSFGLLDRGSDSGILSYTHQGEAFSTSIGNGMPEWATAIYKVRSMLGTVLGFKSKEIAMFAWIYDRANEHSKPALSDDPDAPADFNQKMLSMISKGKLLEENRDMTIGLNIGAGSDTTGSTLGALAWYLLKHPNTMIKLRQEIAELASAGRLSDPVTFAEAQNMPYLQAIIKETFRMHPAVGAELPRVVPEGGLQASGYYFPEGTVVGANAWNLHYNKDTFGHDADVFRPERWLEDAERAKKWEHGLFTFGGGARTCIGKNIVLLEMSKVVPQIYRRYDFELCSQEREMFPGFIVRHGFEARVKSLEKPL